MSEPGPEPRLRRLDGWPADQGPTLAPLAPGMLDRLSAAPGRLRAEGVVRWLMLPSWAQALAIYLLSRVVDLVILDRTARFQQPSLWTTPNPGYLGMVGLWDSDWYRQIGQDGYPVPVPRDDLGVARQNAWAFYPAYPLLVRGVTSVTGMSWNLAATLVSLVVAAIAVVLIRILVDRVAGPTLGVWTVVLFCFYPAAPVLQVGYAEGLGIAALVGVLRCLQRRRYLLGIPLVLLVGFSRPMAVPLAGVIVLHLLRGTWRTGPRGDRQSGRGDRRRLASLLALVAAAAVAAVAWPVTAALVTGERSAYTDTEVAWRTSHELVPLRPWWDIPRFLLGDWVGPIVVVAGLLAVLIWLTRPIARVIAGDLRAWAGCYLAYLVLVADPFTPLPRLMLPLFPLGTVLAAASSARAYRLCLTVAFLAGQILWVVWLWRFTPPADWAP
jgi:hypothetical protein